MVGFLLQHLSVLLIFICAESKQHRLTPKECDYIVVGAGSSGSTIAYRLSQESNARVLLLEAGDQPVSLTDVPFLTNYLWGTQQDWSYLTEPQMYAFQGYDGKRNFITRGKALGGSSTMNFMFYGRGNKKDYENWKNNGCRGWSYSDVLPYFKKSEDCRISSINNDGYHQIGGPLTVEYAPYKSKLLDVYLEAGKDMGLKLGDYNGYRQTGISRTQLTSRNGSRCDTEKAFIRLARLNRNLQIITNALVTKVQLNFMNVATSVIFEYQHKTYVVHARKEIILSAGAINSPQLLMLSGIGPAEHLKTIGIPPIINLPGVGQNLHDHVGVYGLSYRISKPIKPVFAHAINEENLRNFVSKGNGPLTVPGGCEALAFFNTKFRKDDDDYPDIELMMSSSLNLIPTIQEQIVEELKSALNSDAFSLIPYILRPKSRGSLRLNSSNPHDKPIIDPRYLSSEEDLAILVEGSKITNNLTKSKAFQDLNPDLIIKTIPGCENATFLSDEYFSCMARSLTLALNHVVGTCKMGDPRDNSTVVDANLKVKGVRGLRVADASVIPSIPSGHVNAVCIMIGEKAADLILLN